MSVNTTDHLEGDFNYGNATSVLSDLVLNLSLSNVLRDRIIFQQHPIGNFRDSAEAIALPVIR